MLAAPALASRLRLLLAVYLAGSPPGNAGRKLSLEALQRLRQAREQSGQNLAAQVGQSERALARALRLGALPKVRRHFERLLARQRDRLAQAQREARLLARAVALYRLLLARAPAWLASAGPGEEPSALEELLDRTREALEQVRRYREHCRRLARARERRQHRHVPLARQLREHQQHSAQLGPAVEALGQRLEALLRYPAPLPPDLGTPPALARLQDDLQQAQARAAALELRGRQLAQSQRQEWQSRERLRRAWERAAQRADAAQKDFHQARAQALRLSLALGRAALAAGQAEDQLRERLGPLRPRELAPIAAACRRRATAWRERTAQTRERLAALDQAQGSLPAAAVPPPGEALAPSAGPLSALARLEELMNRARELYQSQVAQALAQERGARQREAGEASQRLAKATQGREQLRRKLAQRQEQARRALAVVRQSRELAQDRQEQVQALQAELDQGKHLALEWRRELSRAQAEADQWRRLAQELRRENAQALATGRAQRRGLQRDAEDLQARLEELQAQMRSLALLTALAARPAPAAGPHPLEQALLRLAAARRRLTQAGKKATLQTSLILGLSSALVLASPNLPAKATLREHTQNLASLRLTAATWSQAPSGRLSINLVPLDQPLMPLALLDDPRFTGLAEQAGLSPYALYRSLRAAHPGRPALEPAGVERLARQARALARRFPLIFADLAGRCLPPQLERLLAPAPAALSRLTDRLYTDYRRLGYEPGPALAAVLANQRAAEQWVGSCPLPTSYLGRVRPVPEVEAMGLEEFLVRLAPYMAERSQRYLSRLGQPQPDNPAGYSRDLALDMFGAAKLFKVPLSYLLAIAHQETFYANILGDDNLSASPFQIWQPTLPLILRSMDAAGFAPPPRPIRLQNHLTLATYLAAFHLRELMLEASHPAGRRHPAYVDMDKVMLRYNGSPLYAGRVAVRRAELDRFLAVGGS